MDESIDDKSLGSIQLECSRRKFLFLVGNSALLAGTVGLGALSLDFLSPNVLLEPPADVNLGHRENFAPGTVTLLSKHRVFVVRSSQGPYHVLSAVCTHLGCMTGYRSSAGIIACPCHGSEFDPADGSVISGPAPTPLPTFELRLSDQGDLWVNRMRIVAPGTVLKA